MNSVKIKLVSSEMNRGNCNRWAENTSTDWNTKELTYSMATSTSRRTQVLTGTLKNVLTPWLPVPHFMQPDISLPCSQQSAALGVLSHLNSVHAIQFTF